jgi:riboflavin kinase / FMN adenylyltransferase
MKVTRGYLSGAARPYPVATIGNFDGHHIGHRCLLNKVVETARRVHGTSMVLTFDPHPIKILAPHVDLRFLTSQEEKLHRFQQAGIEEVVFLEFNQAFAELSPQDFAETILSRGLGLKELFVGQHFAFGHQRAGKIADLMALGSRLGLAVHPLPPVVLNGGVVSSTRIRQLVQQGDVRQAAQLLGRPYGISGTVSHGAQRGETLGWPTANLHVPPERVIPPDGVYATVTVLDGQRHDSVAYIGTRPTFDAGERLLEVYVLEGSHALYGRVITVEFVEALRGDLQFPDAAALSRQIALDVDRAHTILRQHHETVSKG